MALTTAAATTAATTVVMRPASAVVPSSNEVFAAGYLRALGFRVDGVGAVGSGAMDTRTLTTAELTAAIVRADRWLLDHAREAAARFELTYKRVPRRDGDDERWLPRMLTYINEILDLSAAVYISAVDDVCPARWRLHCSGSQF